MLYTNRGVSVTYIGDLTPISPLTPTGFNYKSLSPPLSDTSHHFYIMAYGYRSRYSRRRRTSRRTGRRRHRIVRRTTKRVSRPRRMMSRRRILNISSTKKKDNMLIYTNVIAARNPTNTTYTTNAAVLVGGSSEEYAFPWCPSAREIHTGTTDEVNRNTSHVYARGLKESLEINPTSNRPWQWRRIGFYSKGLMPAFQGSTSQFLYQETSNGYARIVNEITGTPKSQLYSFIFDGVRNIDWIDPMIAKLDNNRVTICYDKTVTITPPTTAGAFRKFNRWHGVNKNIVYEDDENGTNMIPAAWSNSGRQGVGDLTIIDFFRPATGSTSSDLLTFTPQATWYWHEK